MLKDFSTRFMETYLRGGLSSESIAQQRTSVLEVQRTANALVIADALAENESGTFLEPLRSAVEPLRELTPRRR